MGAPSLSETYPTSLEYEFKRPKPASFALSADLATVERTRWKCIKLRFLSRPREFPYYFESYICASSPP